MNAPQHPRPPRLAAWCLGKLLPYDPYDASLGDLEEVYRHLADERGRPRATAWYWMQVLLALPPSLRNASYWGVHMLTHYLKTAQRGFRKNKAASLINMIGLSIAVGCAVVLFLFIDMQMNMDAFHEHADEIYLVESVVESGGQEQTWGHSPLPLGPALQQDLPQVRGMVRMANGRGAVRYEDLIFNERISFVDPAFFDVFTFPLRYGEARGFHEENALILSAPAAERYFGLTNPVGEQVTVTFNNTQVETFIVRGVAETIPYNASFKFNILIPYEKQRSLGRALEDWADNTSATFVRLDPLADKQALAAQLASYAALQQRASPDRPITRFILDPLRDIPTQALALRESPLAQIHPATAWLCGLMAFMILAISCFNYVNFAIVAATRRAKEIGIRKVVGSYRWQLVAQFLGENLLLGFLALLLGVTLAAFIFIPGLNNMIAGVGFSLNFAENVDLWIFLALILTLTALGAGLYPALYVSAFQPAKVLKGLQSISGKSRLTRVLLTAQFVFSFVLLASALITIQNAGHQRSQDWGYHQEQTLVVPIPDGSQYTAYANEVAQYPAILRRAGTVDHIGRGGRSAAVSITDDAFDVMRFDVGFGYLEAMKLHLQAGRWFAEDRRADGAAAVIVNETFVEEIGRQYWEAETPAIGNTIDVGGQAMEIVGVVADFHYQPFLFGIEPVVLRVADEEALRYLVVDVQPGKAVETAEYLEATWAQLFPEIPYTGFFQDQIFDEYFKGMDRGAKIFSFMAAIALFISIMGLFGLVPLTIAKRMKEISIRKVLGASLWDVVRLIQRDLVVVLGVALVIGGTLSFFAANALPSVMFSANWEPGIGIYLFPALLIIASAFVASFAGIYKGAMTNPVDVLRMGSQ